MGGLNRADAARNLFYVLTKKGALLRGTVMQKFFLRSLLVCGFVVGAAACTDEGEKSWPKTSGSASSSASSSASWSTSASSSNGEAGMG